MGEVFNAIWFTKGIVYGTICGKPVNQINAKAERLVIQTSEIKQFDVF